MRLVTAATILALFPMLLAGCGGGVDDHARVEANLQHYLLSSAPGDTALPIGAGAPRVKDNGCFKLDKNAAWPDPFHLPPPVRLALWNCLVQFGTLATALTVAVDDSAEVVAAATGGMLRRPKPNSYRPNPCKPEPTTPTGSC